MKVGRYTYPDDLYYDQRHAYARVEADVVVEGITDLAQALLGEAFFVELPYEGRRVKQGERLLSIQPMAMQRPVCRIDATISGEVVAVNTALRETPELVHHDPYRAGWLVRIRPDDPLELQGELDNLLRACDPALKAWARRELAAARLRDPDLFSGSVRVRADEYDYPDELYFNRSHAFVRLEDGLAVEGITDLGQELLGEALFVELPYVGRKVKQGDRLLSVQPMAMRGRVRHLRAAVSGTVVAVNKELAEHPDAINYDPYGAGWVAKIRPTSELETELRGLMRASDAELLTWVEKELEAEGLRRPGARPRPTQQSAGLPVPKPVPIAPLRLGDIPLVNGAEPAQATVPTVAGYGFPNGLYYDSSHAYARVEEGLVVEGLTDLAQGMLGEVLFVELPPVGRWVKQGDRLLSVQSTARDRPVRRIAAVVSGEIVDVNDAVVEDPACVGRAPYGDGWLVRIRPTEELDAELANLWRADDQALVRWAWEEFERDAPPLEFLERFLSGRTARDEMERLVYSRDLAPVPDLLVKPLGIQATPDLIVRPTNAEEIAVVIKHAARHRIPVTPRASASTVYFNTVPYRGGILLDLGNVRGEPVLDDERGTVIVGSATRWAELDEWLRHRGWAVLTYPTSAPTATVGGWFSMEGFGIGSLSFGCVHQHVVRARVVLPDGRIADVTDVSDPPLAWFAGTEGTLGILTEFELKVRRVPEVESHHLIAFPSGEMLRKAAVALAQGKPRPYNMHYSDVSYHRLLEQSGYPSPGDRPALAVDLEGSAEEVHQGILNMRAIIGPVHGRELPAEMARREWKERFNALHAKRAGPSLLAAEVRLPLDRVDVFIRDVERLGRLMGVEFFNYGTVIAPDAAMAFAMYRSDETKILDYVMSLGVTKRLHDVGRRHGGHAYGVGLWNTPYLEDIFTKDQIAEMRRRKAEQDPRNILNPGKLYRTLPVLPPVLFKVGLSALSIVTALQRRLRRVFSRPAPSPATSPEQGAMASPTLPVSPAPAVSAQLEPAYVGVASETLICAQCGYCRSVCPVFDVLGWETTAPRGKIAVAKNLRLGNGNAGTMPEEFIQRLYQCTLCGSCGEVCPTGIDTRRLWLDLREAAGTTPTVQTTFGRLKQCITDEGNITCEPGDARLLWMQQWDQATDELIGRRGAEWLYLPGCVSSLFPMVNSIPRAFTQILSRAGLSFTLLGKDECCCGFPLLAAGLTDQARQAAALNVARARALGVDKIVTSCPSCYHTWKHTYPELTGEELPFAVWHSTELLGELVASQAFPLYHPDGPVTYHDPCDLGRTSGIFDLPRSVLTSIEGLQLIEMARNRENAFCCGGGGNLEMVDRTLASEIGRRKMAMVSDTGAKTVVSACQQCKRSLTGAARATKTRVRVKDITEVVWEAIQAADRRYELKA